MMGDHLGGHLWVVHADAEAIAGDAGLGDFKERGADAVAVADADFAVRQAIDGEIFAELPVGKIGAAELALPVTVGVELVDHDRAIRATVAAQIALAVTVDIQAPDHEAARSGSFENAGVHGLAAPADVAWQADVDRY